MYIVEGPKYTRNSHENQLQKRRLNDSNDVLQRRTNRHHFRHVRFRSSPTNTWNTSLREEKEIHRPVYDRPKKKKILSALLRCKRLGGRVLWEPYPSYHNGFFSPLLVLEISLPGEEQYRCYPNSTRLLNFFHVTPSFICYLISVFVFSLVTLSGSTTYSEPEWTCEQWQWRCTMHSPKLLHYYHIVLCHFPDIRWRRLISLQRSCRCSLQPNSSQQCCKWLNDSIWPIDGNIEGITTPKKSGSGSNMN